MVEVGQRGIGHLDSVLTQEPAGHVLEHVHGDALGALAHGGDAQIGAMSYQGCQQRRIDLFRTRLVSAKRPKGSREVRLAINVAQQILDPHARKAGFDEPAQGLDLCRNWQSIAGMQLELSVHKGGEWIFVDNTDDFASDFVKLARQSAKDRILFLEQA